MTSNVLLALGYLFIAYAIAHLQMTWLAAYHDKNALRAANTDALLTGLHYVPLVFLIATENWLIVVADVVANWVASYRGVKKRVQND